MKRINSEISKKYEDVRKIAVDEMIRLARNILKNHKRYDECIIAMGVIYFTIKGDKNPCTNTVDLNKETMDKSFGYTYSLTYKYLKPLADFISEWDGVLKLTGEGIRFRANGEIVTDW